MPRYADASSYTCRMMPQVSVSAFEPIWQVGPTASIFAGLLAVVFASGMRERLVVNFASKRLRRLGGTKKTAARAPKKIQDNLSNHRFGHGVKQVRVREVE